MPLRWVDENSLARVLAGLFAGRHRARLQDGQLQGKSVADAGHAEGIGRAMGDGLQNTTPCLVESGVGRNTTRVLASDRAWISRGQLWSRLAGGLLVHVPQEWPGCFSATASHRRRSPCPDWRRVTPSPSLSSSRLLIPRRSLVGMPGALPVFGVPAADGGELAWLMQNVAERWPGSTRAKKSGAGVIRRRACFYLTTCTTCSDWPSLRGNHGHRASRRSHPTHSARNGSPRAHRH